MATMPWPWPWQALHLFFQIFQSLQLRLQGPVLGGHGGHGRTQGLEGSVHAAELGVDPGLLLGLRDYVETLVTQNVHNVHSTAICRLTLHIAIRTPLRQFL